MEMSVSTNNADHLLKSYIKTLTSVELQKICLSVIENKDFRIWPASLSKHHCWRGGLLEHTYEVVEIAVGLYNNIRAINNICQRPHDLNLDVIITSAIFHDFGKINDYKLEDAEKWPNKWVKDDHYKKIHHLCSSFLMFNERAKNILGTQLTTEISHCILAHHRELNYGSPVEPITKEAWIVHMADLTSVCAIEKRWENA